MKCWRNIFLLIIIVAFLSGCMRAVPKVSVKSLQSFSPVVAADINFTDDLDPASLELAIERSINYYENAGRNKVYRIADRLIGAQQLKETLTAFRTILRKTDNTSDLNKKIAMVFNVYRIAGTGDSNHSLFTGYYEPLLEGSLKHTEKSNIRFIECRLI